MTLIILLHALFGVSMPISKVLLVSASPLFLTGVRMGIAGVVLLLYEKFKNRKKLQFHFDHLIIFAQIIFFGMFASYILRFYALRHLPAGKSSFLFNNFSPLLSSLYAYVVFREKMTKKQWFGLLIGFIGMIPILIGSSKEEIVFSEFYFISLPEFIMLIAAVFHSYSYILIQKLVRDYTYSPALVNGITMGLGGALSFCISLGVETDQCKVLTVQFTALLAFLILVSNVVCHTLYAQLLRKYSATFLAFSGFLSPLFSIFYGWSFLNEIVSWNVYASIVIVMIGLYLFYQDEKVYSKQSFVEEV